MWERIDQNPFRAKITDFAAEFWLHFVEDSPSQVSQSIFYRPSCRLLPAKSAWFLVYSDIEEVLENSERVNIWKNGRNRGLRGRMMLPDNLNCRGRWMHDNESDVCLQCNLLSASWSGSIIAGGVVDSSVTIVPAGNLSFRRRCLWRIPQMILKYLIGAAVLVQ